VGLLGPMLVLFLIFLRNLPTVFHIAAPFCIPTNSAQGFQFLHILTNTHLLFFLFLFCFVFVFLIIVILTGEWWFWFVFPWWLLRLNIFSWAYWLFVLSLEIYLIQILWPSLNWVCLFIVESFFIYSRHQTSYQT